MTKYYISESEFQDLLKQGLIRKSGINEAEVKQENSSFKLGDKLIVDDKKSNKRIITG